MKYILFIIFLCLAPLFFANAEGEKCAVYDTQGKCVQGHDPNCPPGSSGQPGSCVKNLSDKFASEPSELEQKAAADRLEREVIVDSSVPTGTGTRSDR